MIRDYITPKKVCRQETLRCRQVYKRLLKSAKKKNLLSAEEIHLFKITIVYCVDQVRGRAYCNNNTITIPLWCLDTDKGGGYLSWYVAHEMAHILAWKRYKNSGHDLNFYRCLVELCPPANQKYEYDYMKLSAKRMRKARRLNKERDNEKVYG